MKNKQIKVWFEGRDEEFTISQIKKKLLDRDNFWATKDFIDSNDGLPVPLWTWLEQLAEEQEGYYYANKQANHDYWLQEDRISDDPEIR
jgi:hypothetical protein|tara:strand:+ start:114 stop:380 length:267 start_codon:yes stop_codon:yes gene_type:complete